MAVTKTLGASSKLGFLAIDHSTVIGGLRDDIAESTCVPVGELMGFNTGKFFETQASQKEPGCVLFNISKDTELLVLKDEDYSSAFCCALAG